MPVDMKGLCLFEKFGTGRSHFDRPKSWRATITSILRWIAPITLIAVTQPTVKRAERASVDLRCSHAFSRGTTENISAKIQGISWRNCDLVDINEYMNAQIRI